MRVEESDNAKLQDTQDHRLGTRHPRD